ncbi:hypothetical protein GCM10027168_27080 [Streptomyces capparidis]
MTARPSWFFGTGATRSERALACLAGLLGVAAVAVASRDLPWPWWMRLLAAVLVFDLAGGVVANGLDAAKRFHHGPLPLPPTAVNRFLHHGVGFAAVHVQPMVIGLVFGGPWWWGPLWYGWALAGVLLVRRTRPYLTRPVGLLVVLAGVLVAPSLPAPAGFAWMPAVLLLKLVLAHAVPERPWGEPALGPDGASVTGTRSRPPACRRPGPRPGNASSPGASRPDR